MDFKELCEIGKPIVSSVFEVSGPGLVTPEAFFLVVDPTMVTLKFEFKLVKEIVSFGTFKTFGFG
jgi:hypothetical protein